MGIPSYFVHVVKTIKRIVKPLSALRKGVHNLYMDCNGIIYDAVRVLKVSDYKKQDAYEAAILQHVCDKIAEYVQQVKPSNRVFLTFDGVAPVAKLNQQRERRYKTWYTAEIEKEIERKQGVVASAALAVDREYSWTTACITPGTRFMDKLHSRMSEYVATSAESTATDVGGSSGGSSNSSSRPAEYMLSSSREPGEGEHKIFEFIRANPDAHRDQVTLVYGLDADLIMLTLNHLHISRGIYLYRETPEFIQSIDSQLKPNEQYYMDIPHMSDCIARYMTSGSASDGASADVDPAIAIKICPTVKKHLVYDYIFMFFLMGNDFMPHFPSMNIRTTGPDTVMNAYKITFQNTLVQQQQPTAIRVNRSFIHIDDGSANALRINWDSVRDFMQCLAEVEHSRLLAEHTLRDKRARMGPSGSYERATLMDAHDNHPAALHSTGAYNSISEMLVAKCKTATDVLHIPSKERGLEHYIAPQRQGWEERYYMALFGERVTDRRCQAYCINYLEGLEWTFQYYTRGCVDWRWRYKYSYAPLLVDLVRFIPVNNSIILLEPKPKDPIRDMEQLRYVLPPAFQSALIPADPVDASGSSGLSVAATPFGLDDVHFKWAYCKYFWEAHIVL